MRELIAVSRTLHTPLDALADAGDAVAELLLRGAQVLIRIGQMLDFIVELLLDLRQLLRGELCQVD